MRILFYFSHPAQFHFSKHSVEQLKAKGHRVDIVAKTKDILTHLIEEMGWEYKNIQSRGRAQSVMAIFLSLLKRDIKLFWHCLNKKYDLLVGTDASLTHVGAILGIPRITILEDDYRVIRGLADLTYPFTSCIFTPAVCDVGRWEDKKIGYNGYMKLAYLHPNHFSPNRDEVRNISATPYYIIRLSGLKAHHDFGIKGITEYYLEKIIEKLKHHGRVFISSEKELPKKFSSYLLNIPVSKIHHHLYFAEMLICDSQSMAVEAAMLGTPSVRISSFSGKITVLEELEYVYKLTYGYQPDNIWKALHKIEELVNNPLLRSEYRKRRNRMLQDKIDVTAFFTWFVEKYPQSLKLLKANPDYQLRFGLQPAIHTEKVPEMLKNKHIAYITSSN